MRNDIETHSEAPLQIILSSTHLKKIIKIIKSIDK